jgi:DNA-binding MarR family transcriptional regulator
MPEPSAEEAKRRTAEDAADDAFEFHAEPGHLVRRLHQIATSLFLDQSRSLGVTPVQYAALNAIASHPGFEQREIARLIAVDRTTINMVTRKLEERGWVVRTPLGRAVNLSLTSSGQAVLDEIASLTGNHGDELLAPLSRRERMSFVEMLERLVEHNNGLSRVPMRKPRRRGRNQD